MTLTGKRSRRIEIRERLYLVALRTPLKVTGEYNRLIDLANLLRHAGLEVDIVSGRGRRVRVNNRRAEGFWAFSGELFSLLLKILRLRRNPGLFFIMLPTLSFSIFADIIKCCTRKPVIVYFESQLAKISRRHLWDDLTHEFSFYFFRLCFGNRLWARLSSFVADRYIVSSRYQARELYSVGARPAKVAVIRNIMNQMEHTGTATGLRATHHIPADVPMVGYLGHYFHVKGVDLLIRAFRCVKNEIPDARLAIAWSGLGNKSPIERLITTLKLEDAIVPVGRVQPPEFFKACDVLVLPYRYTFGTQLLPNTLVEALSVGIPVVTSDLPPLTEIVTTKTGVLCRARDIEALTRAMTTLLQARAQANSYRRNQRALFQDMFNRARIGEQYMNLIEDILNEN